MAARYIEADRKQLRWETLDLDSLLTSDHRARVVWAYVAGLALPELYERDQVARRQPWPSTAGPEGAAGAVAVYGAGGSARQLARLCERDVTFRWLCGGAPVNYHGLSDFRVGHGAAPDRLLIESVTGLIAAKVVTLDEIAIDGTR